MSKKAKKPKGFREFDALARKLVQVPKSALDKQITKEARRKARRKK